MLISEKGVILISKKYMQKIILAISLFLILALSGKTAYAIEKDLSLDIILVSEITAEQLKNYSPKWCELYCELIIELSQEHGISSEFAVSVFRYEYVEERKSVGGWKSDDKYSTYDSTEDSIRQWFKAMEETYSNAESWHYEQTGSTILYDIAPLYNQGSKEYNEKSEFWYEKISEQWKTINEGGEE